MGQQKDTDDLSAALSQAIESEEDTSTREEKSALERSLDSTGAWERQGTGRWEKQEPENLKPEDFGELAIDFSDEAAPEPKPAIESGLLGTTPVSKQRPKADAKPADSAPPGAFEEAPEKSGLEKSLDSTSGTWVRKSTGSWTKKDLQKKSLKDFDDLSIDFSDEPEPAPNSAIEKGLAGLAVSEEPLPPRTKGKSKPKAAANAARKRRPKKKSLGANPVGGLSLESEDTQKSASNSNTSNKKKEKLQFSVESSENSSTALADDEEEIDLSDAFGGGGVRKKVKRKRSAPPAAAASSGRSPDTRPSESESTVSGAPAAEKLVIYDAAEKKEEIKKLVLCATIGSVVGAMAWAGLMYASFGFGGRLSLLALAFFSAFGARMGADQVRGRKVRLVAGISAMFSAVLAKFFLVILISITFSTFTENDLMELTDPGSANEEYTEQQMENYMEYLDTGDDGFDDSEYIEADEEYYEEPEVGLDSARSAPSAMSFFQIFFSLFSIFDLPFMIIAAIVAGKLAVDSS